MTEPKTERTEIDPPAADPCAACPWRTANHGKPHPDGYYTDANRKRLWAGLRTGDAPGMTCHPTDPENQPVKASQRTRECTGAWILLLREQRAFEQSADLRSYQRCRKLALTRDGFLAILGAMLPAPFGRGLQGTRVNDSEVSIGLKTGR